MKAADLTRWNRAGLDRFRYVDGNAATFVEDLRLELLARFAGEGAPSAGRDQAFWRAAFDAPDGARATAAASLELLRWQALWRPLPDEPETVAEWRERLGHQLVRTGESDPALEIVRAMARALHVLAETLDAHANEGFLGTARDFAQLRRLAAMVDYRPKPPASATAPLVLIAREAGKLEAGFKVEHQPPDGPPLVFESLEAVKLEPGWNALELEASDKNVSPMAPFGMRAWPAPSGPFEVKVGSLAVLEREGAELAPCRVSTLGKGRLTVAASKGAETPKGLLRGDALLHLGPRFVRKPNLTGQGVVEVDRETGLVAGDVVAWQEGASWRFADVLEAKGPTLRLSGDGPPAGTPLVRTGRLARETTPFAVSDGLTLGFRAGGGFAIAGTRAPKKKNEVEQPFAGEGVRIVTSYASTYFAIAPAVASLAVVLGAAPANQTLTFAGVPGPLEAGAPVIVELDDKSRSARRIEAIETAEASFMVELDQAPPAGRRVRELIGAFAYIVRPEDALVDQRPLASGALALAMNGSAAPPAGRRVVLEQAEPFLAHAAVIAEVGPAGIVLEPPPPAGFVRGRMVVRGNVVMVGHGETQPPDTLGQAVAGLPDHVFAFDKRQIARVPDPGLSSGVRAAIEVRVEGERYHEVERLDEAGPDDAVFATVWQDSGALELRFGDDRHGRRLPAGARVTVGWRKGVGLKGNLSPFAIDEIASASPLVDAVLQPIAASGGAEREAPDAIRQAVPASLRALDRAVTPSDMAHLALRRSGIAQARAFLDRRIGARGARRVEVVVVPEGGGPPGALAAELRSFLLARSLPGVAIEVRGHAVVEARLAALILVETAAFDPAVVSEAVRDALALAFSLAERRLGQTLHIAEVIAVVEGVEGVRATTCRILGLDGAAPRRVHEGPDGDIRAVFAEPDQVIHLGGGVPEVAFAAYHP